MCSIQYARIQAIGINLWPPSEKNHNFQKNASILINKVTFFLLNICPHDKTNLKVLRKPKTTRFMWWKVCFSVIRRDMTHVTQNLEKSDFWGIL